MQRETNLRENATATGWCYLWKNCQNTKRKKKKKKHKQQTNKQTNKTKQNTHTHTSNNLSQHKSACPTTLLILDAGVLDVGVLLLAADAGLGVAGAKDDDDDDDGNAAPRFDAADADCGVAGLAAAGALADDVGLGAEPVVFENMKIRKKKKA